MKEGDLPKIRSVNRRGVAVTSAFLLSVFGVTSAVGNSPTPERRAAATTTTVDLGTRINLSFLPDSLPQAVAQRVASVLDISIRTMDHPSWMSVASGVKISNLAISAGHLLKQPDGLPHNDYGCGDLLLTGRAGEKSLPAYGTVFKAEASYLDNESTADISILETKKSRSFSQLPNSEISDTPPSVGQFVYFVNYEPSSETLDRNPAYAELKDFDDPTILPAIYLGIILEKTPTGRYAILTGLKNLGAGMEDTLSRGGASGGPVYDEQGKIIGLVTKATGKDIAPEIIETNFNVVLENIPKSSLSVSFIQPVTSDLVSNLEQAAETNPDCIPVFPRS